MKSLIQAGRILSLKRCELKMVHFRPEEFRCRCCGGLPPFARANIEALVENVLDPARERLGLPIVVNGGYRCPKHNAAVGGVRGSQHMKGEAADIVPVGFRVKDSGFRVELARLVEVIRENGKFDQLIIYLGFVHVGLEALRRESRAGDL